MQTKATAILENGYHNNSFKKCVRIDPETNELVDKELILTLFNSFLFYYRFSSLDEFFEKINDEQHLDFNLDLISRNKSHPYKIRVAGQIVSLFSFCIDYFLETE